MMSLLFFHTKQRSTRVKNTTDHMDEALCTIEADDKEDNNVGCQVRRKIEDYLERRRYQDELGEIEKETR